MSLSRETMLELMALADGELEGSAKQHAERLADESEEARRVLEAMRGSAVRAWLGDAMQARAMAADGIADAVMERLVATGAPTVVSQSAQARRPSSTRSALTRWRAVAAGAVFASGLAVAAGVAILVHARGRGFEASPAAQVGAPIDRPDTLATRAAAGETSPQGRGVEVEEIDSSSHVSIFEIQAIANASAPPSVVVWIDDDPGEK